MLLGSICLMLILVALPFISACAKPAPAPVKPVEFKLSTHQPPTSQEISKNFAPWAKRVEEATNGGIKITIYAGGALTKYGQGYDGILSGVTDITWDLPGYYPGRLPVTDVVGLLFLGIDHCWSATRIVWGLYEKFLEMRAEYREVKCSCLPDSRRSS